MAAELTAEQLAFLRATHSAAMVTLKRDGTAHAVQVGVALVDGRVQSSGTRGRARTRQLRRDPRCTLFVFDGRHSWLSLETRVAIHDGADAAERNLRLFRVMQGRSGDQPLSWFGGDLSPDEFLRAMEAEGRLVYEFDIERAYGLIAS
jgi:PPOX class probable F420-dependent enzyme